MMLSSAAFEDAQRRRDAHCHTRMCKYDHTCRDLSRGFCRFAHHEDQLRCFAFSVNGTCMRQPCDMKHTPVPDECLKASHTRMCPVAFASRGAKPEDAEGPEYVRHQAFVPLPPELKAVIAQCKADALRSIRLPGDVQQLMLGLFSKCKAGTASMQERKDLLSWQLLVEEATCLHDVRRYDIAGVGLRHPDNAVHFNKFRIDCEGLAEKRPSVLRGDEIHAKDLVTNRWHQGYVWWSNLDHVVADFAYGSVQAGRAYHIVFTVPRSPMLAQHGGVQCTMVMASATLASTTITLNVAPQLPLPALLAQATNDHRLNQEQTRFVERALAPQGAQLRILHGPPGTGKTTTVVALIDAIVRAYPTARILTVTPSNMSADLIVERLVKKLPMKIAHAKALRRVNALGRDPKSIPEIVKAFSGQDNKGNLVFPTSEELAATRIVVCTLVTSSKVLAVTPRGAPHETYDFIIIDEAGQATEAETCIAMAFAHPRNSRIIFAGDHKQLGPVIRNPVCRQTLMGRSPLERLGEERAEMHMLVENFRSQPGIIELFNPTYGGRLRCMLTADSSVECRRLCANLRFPVPDHPVAFLHSEGEETRESDSPSWMNKEEIDVVIATLERFIQSGYQASDVVVLTPYAKQCQKIKRILYHNFFLAQTWAHYLPHNANSRVEQVQVCTVEQFQGREAKLVILSCVRSRSEDMLAVDARMAIGFLSQRQRLNVALSRARDALVIVGNARLLWTNDCEWARVIRTIHARGALINAKTRVNLSLAALGAPAVDEVSARGPGGDDEAAGDIDWRREGQ